MINIQNMNKSKQSREKYISILSNFHTNLQLKTETYKYTITQEASGSSTDPKTTKRISC